MQSITIEKRNDGFGAQYQNLIFAILYSEAHNYKFVYPQIEEIEHNYWNESTWTDELEFLMNLKGQYSSIAVPQIIPNEVIYKDVESKIDLYSKFNSMRIIKDLFWENKDKELFKGSGFNIAVHIRRSNSRDCRIEGTDTPNSYYTFIINTLREKYKENNPQFHIYSQGAPENFVIYKSKDTTLHLDEALQSTFTAMVAADVLITSASSLSYVAALLSDNIVYYLPFWHPPKKEWNILLDMETIYNNLNTKLHSSECTNMLKILTN